MKCRKGNRRLHPSVDYYKTKLIGGSERAIHHHRDSDAYSSSRASNEVLGLVDVSRTGTTKCLGSSIERAYMKGKPGNWIGIYSKRYNGGDPPEVHLYEVELAVRVYDVEPFNKAMVCNEVHCDEQEILGQQGPYWRFQPPAGASTCSSW